MPAVAVMAVPGMPAVEVTAVGMPAAVAPAAVIPAVGAAVRRAARVLPDRQKGSVATVSVAALSTLEASASPQAAWAATGSGATMGERGAASLLCKAPEVGRATGSRRCRCCTASSCDGSTDCGRAGTRRSTIGTAPTPCSLGPALAG